MVMFILLVFGGPIIASIVGYFNANRKLLAAGIPSYILGSFFRPFKIAINSLGVAIMSIIWLIILGVIPDLLHLPESWVNAFYWIWIIGTIVVCYVMGRRMTFNGFYADCVARIQLVEKEYAKYVYAASSLIDKFQQDEAVRKRDEIGASLRILQDARAKFEVLM